MAGMLRLLAVTLMLAAVGWQPGEVEAGGFEVRFGRNPIGSDVRSGEDFDEIFWRMRVKHEPGWQGNPDKLTRAISFAGAAWSEAMIAHLCTIRCTVSVPVPIPCRAENVGRRTSTSSIRWSSAYRSRPGTA